MKKVKLSLDELAVESFSVEGADAGSGTVRANEAATGQPFTCDSCEFTCRTIACPCLVSEDVTACVC